MANWFENFGNHLVDVWNNPSKLLDPMSYISWIAPDIFGYAPEPQSKENANTDIGALGNANFFEGIDNSVTGNVDFQRQYLLTKYANSFNAEQAQLTRDFNAQENQKQRDWYTELSNTAYQRQVKDMQNAGLNPYLTLSSGAPVSYGSSANSPTASASGVSSTHSGSGLQAVASILNSVMNMNAVDNFNEQALIKVLSKLV